MKTKSKILIFMSLLFIAMIFTVVSAFAAVDEREPNDTKQKANAIKVGSTVYGTFPSDDDRADWFTFTPPVSGTMKITITCDRIDPVHGSLAGIDAYVYDSNSRELVCGWDDLDTNSGRSFTFGAIYGKAYYVSIHPSYAWWGDYHFKISYSIGKTTIKSVKGKKRGFTVKWNKKRKASFYQVQYTRKSVYSDYNWSKAKIVKVSNKAKSKTIKKLAKKKKYYVRVRVARKIDGVTYYSGWCKKKMVKTR